MHHGVCLFVSYEHRDVCAVSQLSHAINLGLLQTCKHKHWKWVCRSVTLNMTRVCQLI